MRFGQRTGHRHHARSLILEVQNHTLRNFGADALGHFDRVPVAKRDGAADTIWPKRAQNGQRCLGPHPLNRGQQPVPFFFHQGLKAEKLHEVFADHKIGEQGYDLAHAGQRGHRPV